MAADILHSWTFPRLGVKTGATPYKTFKTHHLNVLYESPDDDSLGIETCSNEECHLLNWVVFDWHVLIVTLHKHYNTMGSLSVSLPLTV